MRAASIVLSIAAFVLVLGGCSLEPGENGSACVRTTQCGTGLACVEGRCSTNLQAIADESTIPSFAMPDAGGDAATDGAVEAGSSAVDASTPAADGGGGDASGASSDAATPGADAAISGNDAG